MSCHWLSTLPLWTLHQCQSCRRGQCDDCHEENGPRHRRPQAVRRRHNTPAGVARVQRGRDVRRTGSAGAFGPTTSRSHCLRHAHAGSRWADPGSLDSGVRVSLSYRVNECGSHTGNRSSVCPRRSEIDRDGRAPGTPHRGIGLRGHRHATSLAMRPKRRHPVKPTQESRRIGPVTSVSTSSALRPARTCRMSRPPP